MRDVKQHYDEHVLYEWKRLERHRTEFAVTLRAFADFLPKPPASVLDIGGGPGRYAITLTKQGYSVALADISRASLDFAQEQAKSAGVSLARVIHTDALQLEAIASSSYNAVLLMGPLYHLLTFEERLEAVREARRVLKRNGYLFAAFITRFAPLRKVATNHPEWAVTNRQYVDRLLETGIHDQGKKFPHAYFAHPDEIVPLMEEAGVVTVDLVGCEGVVAGHEARVNDLTGETWEVWVDLNYRLGKERALHGAADHLLYIGMKDAA